MRTAQGERSEEKRKTEVLVENGASELVPYRGGVNCERERGGLVNDIFQILHSR